MFVIKRGVLKGDYLGVDIINEFLLLFLFVLYIMNLFCIIFDLWLF